MHRYNNIEFILKFDIDEVMGMYYKAKKENDENRLWEQWKVDYARMDKDHFTSYKDYKKRASSSEIENNVKLDKEKILAEALEIKNLDQGRR